MPHIPAPTFPLSTPPPRDTVTHPDTGLVNPGELRNDLPRFSIKKKKKKKKKPLIKTLQCKPINFLIRMDSVLKITFFQVVGVVLL